MVSVCVLETIKSKNALTNLIATIITLVRAYLYNK